MNFKITLKSAKSSFLILFILFLFSCSEDPAEPTNGVDGENGFNALVNVQDEPAGENCSSGGVKISVGQDTNNNGVLNDSEVESVSYICNGSTGDNGSQLVARTSPESPGENCEAGGTLVEIGADANGNGSLDNSEVQTSFFVCNGINGEGAGENGLTSLIIATPLEDCGPDNTTGIRIEIGLDEDGDGSLIGDEINASYDICNGADGNSGTNGTNGTNALMSITTFSGDQNGCSNGGIRVAVGLDINGNTILDAGEEVNVEFVCNGETGATGSSGNDGRSVVVTITEDPLECANGGIEITLEYDNDGDGNGDTLIGSYLICNGETGADGAEGVGLLIRKSASDVADCPNGGTFIEIDRDDNRNGLFDDGVVDISFDVCNGENGSPGSNGTSYAISVTAATGCGAAGGYRFTVGEDTDGNGTPDANISFYEICNGTNGSNGSDGNTDGIYEFYFYNGYRDYNETFDTYIDEENTTANFDQNNLLVGSGDRNVKYGLLRFDKLESILETTDNFEVLEAGLYLDAKSQGTGENYFGVKALFSTGVYFDQTVASFEMTDTDNAWANELFDISVDATESFMDMFSLPNAISFDGVIPLRLDRTIVQEWILDPERNAGMALQIASNNNTKLVTITDSESDDIYARPVLYIKIADNNARGRSFVSMSNDTYMSMWKSMTYDEKLAPLKNMRD